MTLQNNTQYIEEDKLDLRELFSVLKRRKKLIWSMTALFTLLALIYVFIAKPVYSGKVMIEIGQITNAQFNDGEYASLAIMSLDDVNNLKNIVTQITGVSASIPKKTKLLTLSTTDFDKTVIKKKLEKATHFILERHQEIAKLYTRKNTKVHMTQIVGDINIGKHPIKPKKALIIIVAFITGLMLSVFLAFFLEFIRGSKEEETQA